MSRVVEVLGPTPARDDLIASAWNVGRTDFHPARCAKLLLARQRASKVEHPFLIIKRIFGFVKTRYKALEKNAHRLFVTLCTG